MECRKFIESMQEADIAALRGDGTSALAVHVRTCDACAKRASLLLRATEFLSESLDDATPVDARFVARRVQAAARPAWTARLASATVAAAALALFAVGVERLGPDDSPATPLASVEVEEASPGVDVPAGRNAVVFRTSNPRITVVWYYPSEGGP